MAFVLVVPPPPHHHVPNQEKHELLDECATQLNLDYMDVGDHITP